MKKNEIDLYIEKFSPKIRKQLKQIRAIIKKAAPDAEEVISYGMPAYKINRVLVYFAGYEHYIGFYPTASGIKAFQNKFKKYAWSKGAVQFPLDEPLPVQLITAMVKYRVKEDAEKIQQRKKNL